MPTNKESKAIAAANPSQGEQRATAAFQGPGVTARTTAEPQFHRFDPEDKPPVRPMPFIPVKYRGRMFDERTDQTLAQEAELYGLETVEIILPKALAENDPNRQDWGVVGLRGKCLSPGDREEMPVNHAMTLVNSGRAVFVISEETVKDEKLIAELVSKGYEFATTTKPAREREEFRNVFPRQRKKDTWMNTAEDKETAAAIHGARAY